jgi:hypothetical protein
MTVTTMSGPELGRETYRTYVTSKFAEKLYSGRYCSSGDSHLTLSDSTPLLDSPSPIHNGQEKKTRSPC